MTVARQIFLFLGLVLTQVLVLNNVAFHGYLNPYIYVYFILFLPVTIERGYVLLLAFLMGFCIDLFENSGGVHIAAAVLLAWLRPALLRISLSRQKVDFEEFRMKNLPLGTALVYSLVGIFIHHFALFLIENYSFREMGAVLLRTLVSGVFTFVLVGVYLVWGYGKNSNTA